MSDVRVGRRSWLLDDVTAVVAGPPLSLSLLAPVAAAARGALVVAAVYN